MKYDYNLLSNDNEFLNDMFGGIPFLNIDNQAFNLFSNKNLKTFISILAKKLKKKENVSENYNLNEAEETFLAQKQ